MPGRPPVRPPAPPRDRAAAATGLLTALVLHALALQAFPTAVQHSPSTAVRRSGGAAQAWLWMAADAPARADLPPIVDRAVPVRLRAPPDLPALDWPMLDAAMTAEENVRPPPALADRLPGEAGQAAGRGMPGDRRMPDATALAMARLQAAHRIEARLQAAHRIEARLQALREAQAAVGAELRALGITELPCREEAGVLSCEPASAKVPSGLLERLRSQWQEARALGLSADALPLTR